MKINLKSAIATKRAIFASKRKQEPPLSKPFKLPINFPDNIKEGLAGENLVGKSRSKFVTRIAEAIYFEKSYPTTEEYVYVAELITDKWPFLKKTAGKVCNYVFDDSACILPCTFVRVISWKLSEKEWHIYVNLMA